METKERREKKNLRLYLLKLSWNGLSKYTTETQWKMTQAARLLSGMVVLAWAHSKLESFFPSLDRGGGPNRKWPSRRVMANILRNGKVLLLDSQGHSLFLWLKHTFRLKIFFSWICGELACPSPWIYPNFLYILHKYCTKMTSVRETKTKS